MRLSPFTILLLGAALLEGCQSREDVWDKPASAPVAHGLAGAAAIIDDTAERALLLPVEGSLAVNPISFPTGRSHASSLTTKDGSKLLVLTRGDVPRRKQDDDSPRLTVIDGSTRPKLLARYDLGDPLSGLAIDPDARFAVVFPSAADSSFVENPNELAIVDLEAPPGDANPTPITLRSFGGRPQSFVFTPTLDIPGGERRLLVVLTDRDVGIVDLRAPALGDITVKLSSSGQKVTPAQVVVSDGAPGELDARLAIRVEGDSGVILVDMLPVPADEVDEVVHDLRPTPNVVVASGVPSDIAFVRTDGGERLAAVVPSKDALALIDPATGIASEVDLGGPFEKLSLVTSIVDPSAAGDIALLWSTSSPEIAFVALGGAVGKPYKSVERLELEQPIARVLDVPAPNDRLKILQAVDERTFFVLDLVERTASPILASSVGARTTLSPDGQRAWLFASSASAVASLDLATLHPRNVLLSYPVLDAFEIARRDGGRALVAVHAVDSVGLTVLDGERPSLETSVDYVGVLLGNLP